MLKLVLILILLFQVIHKIFTANVVKNYCDVNLCGTTKNTACNNTGVCIL